MFFLIGGILFSGLILLRKYCHTGFFIAQIFAGFAWVFVQYNNYFYDFIMSIFPLWLLASLAALAVKPKVKEED